MYPIWMMYVLLIPCVAAYLHTKYAGKEKFSLALKAASTGIVLLTAVIGWSGASGYAAVYAAWIVAGLIFGLAGDVAIGFRFILGMLFFGLGHTCYIAAFFRVSTHASWAVLFFLVFFLIIIGIFRISRMKPGKLLIPGILYAVMITVMLSLAATLPFSFMPGGAVLFAGALLFISSDTMLAFITLGCKSKMLDTVCLYCYFIGQSLIAASLFLA